MDFGPFIALAVSTGLITAGQLLWPTREKRLRRALAALPGALVRDANGVVRVTGLIRAGGPLLEAPLSGRPCVAYVAVVDVPQSGGGRGGPLWRRVVDLKRACPFFLADESGEARSDPAGSFLLARDPDFTGMTKGPYPGKHEALSRLLESRDLGAMSSFGNWTTVHYAEVVIEEGQLVSVGGPSTREIDQMGESSGLRSPPERLVLRGTEAQPLLIGDVYHSKRWTIV